MSKRPTRRAPRRRGAGRGVPQEAVVGRAPSFHVPVLAQESIAYLSPSGDALYLDGTLGGGGHALLVLESCPGCRLVGFDRDPEALARAAEVLAAHRSRVRLVLGSFDEAATDDEVKADGLGGALLDLGVSSHQLDEPGRGFQFGRGAPLDMRMDPTGSAPNAADLLNDSSEVFLADIFARFAEEPTRRARRLAREVIHRRSTRPFETSDDLVGALAGSLGAAPTSQDKARVFQALRIAVNGELECLEQTLPALRDALVSRGVLVVIAYHSLEDRIVKTAFREWSLECVCPPELPICRCRGHALGETLTKRPVRPSEEEVLSNPRSRSARLRAWRAA